MSKIRPSLTFYIFWLLALAVSGLFHSCSSVSPFLPRGDAQMTKAFMKLDLAGHYQTGISIFDPHRKEWVFRYEDDQRFTSASNTKLLTLYASLLFLSDSLHSAWYTVSGDSILIWGGGDPGTLYPDIHARNSLVDFISNRTEKIFFCNAHFQTSRFGSGWAWDDFPFLFQCERTAFPIYGNRLWFDRNKERITVTPEYLFPMARATPDTVDHVSRSEWGDSYQYYYTPNTLQDQREVPIGFLENDIRLCWQEATHQKIEFTRDLFPGKGAMTVKGSLRDTLLKRMMVESDNFIAEQLLLNISMNCLGIMDEARLIDTLMQHPLKIPADDIHWVDGSGLSRYNLMTPRSLVWILDQVYQKKGLDFVKAIFPAGGQSGTIKEWYAGSEGEAFVFAKTGSMQNVHNLSGYLVTKSGRVLIFSWMHNQFKGDVNEIKKAMHSFFMFLYEHY